jgi:hypothetical protein
MTALWHTLLSCDYLYKGTGVLAMQRTLLHFVKAKSEQIHLRMETIADTSLGRTKPHCVS